MCGIVGLYDFKSRSVSYETINSMRDEIMHRGPDGEGTYIKDNIGLGFRRLAIIDLTSSGDQPMTNEDGSLVLIYNGELYNYLELKPGLIAKGHKFHSTTDSEVVLHAYEEYGTKCLDIFKGVYAFAILNTKTKELFLARDKFGTKPLYYTQIDDQFLFASEIKSLLKHPKVKREVSYPALNEYFAFQNIFSDRTLFNNIYLLPAGYWMKISKNGKIHTQQFWDFNINEDTKTSEKDFIEQIQVNFDKAVNRHMIADVPIGSYSSGGMDSGSIIAIATKKNRNLMTFTGGFDLSAAYGIEFGFDERKDSEIIARTFNTQHYEMVIHSGDMARILPKLIWHLEDLRVGMCYQNYYMAQLASKFVKVVLSGAGGDEMFGGYPWRYEIALQNGPAFKQKYFEYWNRLVSDKDSKTFFSKESLNKIGSHKTFDEFDKIINKVSALSPINQALYFEAKTFLHGLNIVEDKVSFAHSLESRVPFLDDDLVDLASKIPAKYKYHNGQGKYILRRALNPLLPKEIINKKKQGFSTPDGSWYRGKSINYIKNIILDKKSLSRNYFNPKYIKNIIDEHSAGKVNHRLLIWSLLSFEWWNRIFIDQENIPFTSDYKR
ncbi:MAG: asparagine synthase (glutamine-hydrolyzing) [bacterium]|nr:asparagine synthase (glutamine-hydrolyzing) [bacterium]